MARITQVGPGRKTVGTIDGVTYVTRNGVTYARSAPTMPASAYNTPAAKKRQALFKLIQMHMKFHLRTIRQTFTPKGIGTPSNRYYQLNNKGLTAALQDLVEQYVAGIDVTITEIEAAISAYAAEHPTSIRIASLSGYQEVFLTGEWPETITLNANGGDSTVIIIVAENGTTTTYNTDGTVVVSGRTDGTDGTDNSGGSGQGGTTIPSNPRLSINRSGSGTATVTAGGNAVSSGAELAAGTEVSLSITPAEGATPTATLGSQALTLTESDGTYSGSFTMPSSNVTLTINTGGTSGGSGSSGEN